MGPANQSSASLLPIVEVAYENIDASDEDWLGRVLAASRPHLDEGFGVAAFEFYRPGDGLPEILQSLHEGIPPKLSAIYPKVFATMDPEIRKRPFRLGPCVTGSAMMGMGDDFREQPHMKKYVHAFGMFDSLWITAAEPSGRGCGFHAGRAQIRAPSSSQVKRWGRVAGHLSTVVRLRRRLKENFSQPSAVLDPGGKVHAANGDASTREALDRLRQAVLEIETLRGPIRLTDPDRALFGWRALVAGRWSLIDQMEHDGRRYIVARENEPTVRGHASLTARERQVVEYAKLGHHNKLIAYELGISDSTVRVLLARASAKLGVRRREDLLRAVPDDAPASA